MQIKLLFVCKNMLESISKTKFVDFDLKGEFGLVVLIADWFSEVKR